MSKKKFSGKTLLVLGSNVGATDIVTYAKENGAYTIVADYYPKEKSAAKQISDEQLSISTADLAALGKVIEDYHVDGVLAGISEFNLLNAMKLSEVYHLPFYCNKQQWDLIGKKDGFRLLCEKYKVPCPKTYFIGAHIPEKLREQLVYPVVMKPIDACTSAGVFICYSWDELLEHEEETLSKSLSKNLIIEEYIHGDEFTAHYTIANGKAALSAVDNRYPVAVHSGQVTTVPAARIYPCLYLDEYIKQVNPAMLNLCENVGLTNAILFIQGFYDEEHNCFYVFEAGLRCAGEAPYRFISKINHVNAMHLLVDQALSADPDFDLDREDPALKGKCCGVVSFVATGGVVGNIVGLEEAVSNTPSVIEYESRYPVGSQTPDGDTLRQLMIRFVLICDDREAMAKDIAYLNSHIFVFDKDGKNMVIKMNPERVFGWK